MSGAEEPKKATQRRPSEAEEQVRVPLPLPWPERREVPARICRNGRIHSKMRVSPQSSGTAGWL